MAEYIEREAVVRELNKTYDNMNAMGAQFYGGFMNAVYRIKNFPAADAAPVRHARWERIGIKGRKGLPIYPCCSACGIVSAAFRSEWEGLRGPWKYCPNCGAKMDG